MSEMHEIEPYREPEREPVPSRLASEQVVISAPMSFTGSAIRLWRLMGERGAVWWSQGLWITAAVLSVTVAWAAVLCWYAIFGIWLVPYRLIRRGARKRRVEALRQRELLMAVYRDTGQQQQ